MTATLDATQLGLTRALASHMREVARAEEWARKNINIERSAATHQAREAARAMEFAQQNDGMEQLLRHMREETEAMTRLWTAARIADVKSAEDSVIQAATTEDFDLAAEVQACAIEMSAELALQIEEGLPEWLTSNRLELVRELVLASHDFIVALRRMHH